MNGGNPPAIAFREVSRSFGGRAVLNNVSFEVAPGEAFCLLGRSGMGKSVTLKLTIGLIQPDAGAICVENDNIVGMDEDGLSKVRSRIGFLFQSAALFDSFSLHDNLAVPLKRLRKKKPDEEIEAIVQKNLEDVGLGKDGQQDAGGTVRGHAQTGRTGSSPYARPQYPAGGRASQRTGSRDGVGDRRPFITRPKKRQHHDGDCYSRHPGSTPRRRPRRSSG